MASCPAANLAQQGQAPEHCGEGAACNFWSARWEQCQAALAEVVNAWLQSAAPARIGKRRQQRRGHGVSAPWWENCAIMPSLCVGWWVLRLVCLDCMRARPCSPPLCRPSAPSFALTARVLAHCPVSLHLPSPACRRARGDTGPECARAPAVAGPPVSAHGKYPDPRIGLESIFPRVAPRHAQAVELIGPPSPY